LFDPLGLQSNADKVRARKAKEAAEKAEAEKEKNDAEQSARDINKRNEGLFEHAKKPDFKKLLKSTLNELRESTIQSGKSKGDPTKGNEFGARIGVNADGQYVAGNIVEGNEGMVTHDQNMKSILPDGYTWIATPHSHPNDNSDLHVALNSSGGMIKRGKYSKLSIRDNDEGRGDINYAHHFGVIAAVITLNGTMEMGVPKGGGYSNWKTLNPNSTQYKDYASYFADNSITGKIK